MLVLVMNELDNCDAI